VVVTSNVAVHGNFARRLGDIREIVTTQLVRAFPGTMAEWFTKAAGKTTELTQPLRRGTYEFLAFHLAIEVVGLSKQ
jgi:hypothetical protein